MTKSFRTVLTLALLVGGALSAHAQDLELSGMSPQSMLQDADERIESMEQTLDEVYTQRDSTQSEEGDLTKVRCINDRIAAIQGFLRLSTDSRTGLQDQIGRTDRDATEHQYTLIVIASRRVTNLRNEATQCAGDILTFSGDTEHRATVDPSIPDAEDVTDDDVANALLNRLASDDPLPEVTPFQ